MAEAAIHRNEQKIIKIQENRIPKLQTKIQEQSKRLRRSTGKATLPNVNLTDAVVLTKLSKVSVFLTMPIDDKPFRKQWMGYIKPQYSDCPIN